VLPTAGQIVNAVTRIVAHQARLELNVFFSFFASLMRRLPPHVNTKACQELSTDGQKDMTYFEMLEWEE
jgi:hypothetical protein